MKLFLRNIFLFSVIVLLLNFGIKLLLNNVYFNSYNEVDLDAQTYLLSDSHGAAIGEFWNDSIYNFSSPSDSYFDIETKLKFLIRNSKIQRILLTVDEHTLSPYRKSLNNLDRSVFYSSMKDFSNSTGYLWSRYIKYNLVVVNPKYGPIVKNYLKSILVDDSAIEEKPLWVEVPLEERKESSLDRFDKQFSFENPSKGLSKSLKKIISLCKSHNIDIVGIKFPISKEYREAMGSKNFHADSVLIKHGYEIYDFNSDAFSDPKYFKDQDHLNSYGAEKFKKAILDSLSN